MSIGPLLIDSFVWLEVLQGSDRGRSAIRQMKRSSELHTSVVNLYEVSYRIRQLRDDTVAEEVISNIVTNTLIHPVDQEIALAAAPLRITHGYGAVDALYHATAVIHGLTILTGDGHFRGIEGAILI